MRFFETVLAGAALVAAALALEINDFPQNPEAGKTYTITYSPKDNTPTQIILRKGESTNLDTVATLGTATGGSFQWTVDSALPSGTNYAIQVKQGDNVNYSKQFPITGGSSASASASASSASASASASSVSASVSSALSSAISSALSSASSAASVATLTTSASASVSSSAGTNTTISSATLSASKSGAATTGKATGSSTSSGGGAPANTGAAAVLGSSPLALIFGAVAAMAYVN